MDSTEMLDMKPPVGVHLSTERLWLRRFTREDAQALLVLDSDPAVRRFVEDGVEVSLANAIETIDQWLANYPPADVFGFWAAIDRQSGEFTGWFHFRPGSDGSDDPELGYRLMSRYWGRGYATEGSQALIDHGFRSGCVDRIVAETIFGGVHRHPHHRRLRGDPGR